MLTTSNRYAKIGTSKSLFTGKYDSKNRLVTLSQTKSTKLPSHKYRNYTIKVALGCWNLTWYIKFSTLTHKINETYWLNVLKSVAFTLLNVQHSTAGGKEAAAVKRKSRCTSDKWGVLSKGRQWLHMPSKTRQVKNFQSQLTTSSFRVFIDKPQASPWWVP